MFQRYGVPVAMATNVDERIERYEKDQSDFCCEDRGRGFRNPHDEHWLHVANL
jgi:hypothetical protein